MAKLRFLLIFPLIIWSWMLPSAEYFSSGIDHACFFVFDFCFSIFLFFLSFLPFSWHGNPETPIQGGSINHIITLPPWRSRALICSKCVQFSLVQGDLEAASLVVFLADRLYSSHDSRGIRTLETSPNPGERKRLSQGYTASRQCTEDSNPGFHTLLDAVWPFRISSNFYGPLFVHWWNRIVVCSLSPKEEKEGKWFMWFIHINGERFF